MSCVTPPPLCHCLALISLHPDEYQQFNTHTGPPPATLPATQAVQHRSLMSCCSACRQSWVMREAWKLTKLAIPVVSRSIMLCSCVHVRILE